MNDHEQIQGTSARLRALSNVPTPLRAYFGRALALKAAEEIEWLQQELRLANASAFARAEEADGLRRERDEARRWVCRFFAGRFKRDAVSYSTDKAMAEADKRGWDCWKTYQSTKPLTSGADAAETHTRDGL